MIDRRMWIWNAELEIQSDKIKTKEKRERDRKEIVYILKTNKKKKKKRGIWNNMTTKNISCSILKAALGHQKKKQNKKFV